MKLSQIRTIYTRKLSSAKFHYYDPNVYQINLDVLVRD